MIYVDTGPFERVNIDDDKAIAIEIKERGETEDLGDEDATKVVTDVFVCNIVIRPEFAPMFKNINHIDMIRWNYYRPCYALRGANQTKETRPDGYVVYHITK